MNSNQLKITVMRTLLTTLAALTALSASAQEDYKYSVNVTDYGGGDTLTHRVDLPSAKAPAARAKNVILFIGDGMGTAQVYSALTANGGDLYLRHMPVCGFSVTESADNYVTDSAAGGTALSCGKRTRNGMLAMTPDSVAMPTILEWCKTARGMLTGVVATSSVTHATPAAFVSHVPDRGQYEQIALSFLDGKCDVFIGGGRKFFTTRADKRDLVQELCGQGYRVYADLASASGDSKPRMGVLTAEEHTPEATKRQPTLRAMTEKALEVLGGAKKGFFLMVEGSQIDWGGHQNDTRKIVHETLDMDEALGAALRYAAQDGETLVVVTADHETGGFTIVGGESQRRTVKGAFTTDHHTGCMVPVFAYGAGAAAFGGIMLNTDVNKRMVQSLK